MSDRSATSATVLVVDDDPEITFQLEYRSKTGRHRYRGIESTGQALDRLRDDAAAPAIDIVIVDFELEGESAVSFIGNARTIRPEIPYVIWSHYPKKHIISRLGSMSLDEVLTIDAAGFAEKKDLLTDSQDLDKFVDAGLERFHNQLSAHVAAAVSDKLRNIDVALTRVKSVVRCLQEIAETPSRDHTRLVRAVGPLAVRLRRAERKLRQVLGYPETDPKSDRDQARAALAGIFEFSDFRNLPKPLRDSLRGLATPHNKRRTENALSEMSNELTKLEPAEDMQRCAAERTGDLVEFLIYAGRTKQAYDISSSLWKVANHSWPLVPRVASAVAHSCALASDGKYHLAEHLVSALLTEVEPQLSEERFSEMSRAIFAEIDNCLAEFGTPD